MCSAVEPLTLIGVGSPQGADAIGLLVAQWLTATADPSRLGLSRVEALDRPGLELLEALHGVDALLLLDAVADLPRGALHLLRPEHLAYRANISPHTLGVAEALALARAVGRLPSRCHILGIGLGDAHPFTSAEIVTICDSVYALLSLPRAAEIWHSRDPIEWNMTCNSLSPKTPLFA